MTGDLASILPDLASRGLGPFAWQSGDVAAFRARLEQALRPQAPPRNGLSPWEVTRCLRDASPRGTIATTDVGSVKFVVSQAWASFEPLTFLESNGLSSMGYALPAAMAAALCRPGRPVLCTVGDGGLGMRLADVETCVRLSLPLVIVVFNDDGLSLIGVVQKKREYPDYGVRYGHVDFAKAAEALGARGVRADTLDGLAAEVREAYGRKGPTLIDVPIDPTEYLAHTEKIRG